MKTLFLDDMIIYTPPFEHSRVARTFMKAYREQEAFCKNEGDEGCIVKAKIAVNAAGITIANEIGLMLMV